MTKAQQEFHNGQTLLQAGRHREARRCFERVVELQPDHAQAWYCLGTLWLADREVTRAESCFQQAIVLQPRFVEAHYHLGVALQLQNKLAAAAVAYRQTVALKSDYLEAHCNLGVVLQAEGRLDEAIAAYRQALRLRPDYAEVHCNLGNALQAKNDLPAAIAAYRQALALKPNFAEVHNSLGVALKTQGQLDDAVAAYRQALAFKPDYLSAHDNLAIALEAKGNSEEAATASRQALALAPEHLPALLNLGRAQQALGRLDDAAAAYRQILDLDPAHAAAHCNLGSVLQAQDRLEEAIAAYRRALAAQPDSVEALTNLGTAFQAKNDLPAALANYRQAIALRPALPQAHFNEAVCLLLAGEMREGWQKYEYRWQCEQRKFKRSFTPPLWLGADSLTGKTLLVYPEQGLGDTLQFVRYVPLLAARGATVLLEVQPRLHTLMNSLPGAKAVYARGEVLPDFDVHCPLLSLPLAFSTTLNDIPASVPYLQAPADKVAHWRERLGSSHAPRIGVVWSGGPYHKTDHLRSIPLEQFKAVLDPNIRFFSLQKEVKEPDAVILAATPEITPLGEQIADFADTAAIIANLDLVISVDTAVAHLAGALGKPTWILLPFAPDWRWLLGRDDSPWYPSARLFRQTTPGDWDSVLQRVRLELARCFLPR